MIEVRDGTVFASGSDVIALNSLPWKVRWRIAIRLLLGRIR